MKRCKWFRFHAWKRDETYTQCEREVGHEGKCRAGDVSFFGGWTVRKRREKR